MAIDTWYKPHNPEQRPPWLLDRKLGGGMLLMDGTHMIDRLLWHLGGKVVAVKAMNGNPVYPEIPADDTAMAFLQFDNGIVATISRIAYRTGITQYGADYFGTNGQLKYRLPYGPHGKTASGSVRTRSGSQSKSRIMTRSRISSTPSSTRWHPAIPPR